jgi:hypothetical protein
MPGGIQGIPQLQRNITLRYIQATQPFGDAAGAGGGLHPHQKIDSYYHREFMFHPILIN